MRLLVNPRICHLSHASGRDTPQSVPLPPAHIVTISATCKIPFQHTIVRGRARPTMTNVGAVQPTMSRHIYNQWRAIEQITQRLFVDWIAVHHASRTGLHHKQHDSSTISLNTKHIRSHVFTFRI